MPTSWRSGRSRCRRGSCGTSSRVSNSHPRRSAGPPFPVEQLYPTHINGKSLDNYTQWFFLTYGITVTGLAVISVPCGFTKSGLPVGLQIVGRRRQEAMVLRAAAAFEAAAPWADKIPPAVKRD